ITANAPRRNNKGGVPAGGFFPRPGVCSTTDRMPTCTTHGSPHGLFWSSGPHDSPKTNRPMRSAGLTFWYATLWAAHLLAPAAAAQPAGTDPAGVEFFEKKVRPILVEHCFKCHSAEAKKLKGGLRLVSRTGLLKGGDNGPALVPGHPEKSRLLEAVGYKNVDL